MDEFAMRRTIKFFATPPAQLVRLFPEQERLDLEPDRTARADLGVALPLDGSRCACRHQNQQPFKPGDQALDFVIIARLNGEYPGDGTEFLSLAPMLFPAQVKYESVIFENCDIVGRLIICSCESHEALERILFDPPLLADDFVSVQIFAANAAPLS